MAQTPSVNRERILAIATELGVSPRPALSKLPPPERLPTLTASHYEQAEAFLVSQRAIVSSNKSSSTFSKFVKRKGDKKVEASLTEIYSALELCIQSNGSPEVARVLVEKLHDAGGDCNMKPLLKASLTKRISMQKKPEQNTSDFLQIATIAKNLQMIAVLAPFTEQWILDYCFQTALVGEDIDTIELLLRHGANASSVDDEHLISYGFGHGRSELIQILIKAPKPPTNISMSRALLPAMKQGNTSLMLDLLNWGADPSINNNECLQYAVRQLNFYEVAGLLASGSLPSPDVLNRTFIEAVPSLLDADYWTRKIVLELLLCAGSYGSAVNDSLLLAVAGDSADIVSLLVQYGASVEYENGAALHLAILEGKTNFLKLLLTSKTPIATGHLSTAITTAVSLESIEKRIEMLEVLAERGASGVAVHEAIIDLSERQAPCTEHHLEFLHLLLKMNGDVNHKQGQAVVNVIAGSNRLLLAPLVKTANQTTLTRAFKAAVKLSPDVRLDLIELLFQAGLLVTDEIHKCVITLAKEHLPDKALLTLLLKNKAQVAYNDYECLKTAVYRQNVGLCKNLLRYAPASEQLTSSVLMATFHQPHSPVWTAAGLQILELFVIHGVSQAVLSMILIHATKELVVKSVDENILRTHIVLFLLTSGACPNFEGGVALSQAAKFGLFDIVRKIVGSQKCSSSTLGYAFSYLFVSNISMSTDVVLEMIALFTKAGLQLRKYKHPHLDSLILLLLNHASRSPTTLQAILDHGSPPDQRFRLTQVRQSVSITEDVTPLLWVLSQKDLPERYDLIKVLLGCKANPNFFTEKYGYTPLIFALQNKDHKAMKILLKGGASPSITDAEGRSPLWYACAQKDVRAIELLVACKADINDGCLHEASVNLQRQIVTILIAAGHSVDYRSPRHEGRTALGEVCRNATSTAGYHSSKGHEVETTIQTLISHGADVAQRQAGKSLLLIAMEGPNPVTSTRHILKFFPEKLINSEFNLYTDASGYVYSPTMYIQEGPCTSPKEFAGELIKMLRDSNCSDVHYNSNEDGTQPKTLRNAPANIVAAERKRKATRARLSSLKEERRIKLEAEKQAVTQEIEMAREKYKMEITRAEEKARIKHEAEMQAAAREHELAAQKRRLEIEAAEQKARINRAEEARTEQADRERRAAELAHTRSLHKEELRHRDSVCRLTRQSQADMHADSETHRKKIETIDLKRDTRQSNNAKQYGKYLKEYTQQRERNEILDQKQHGRRNYEIEQDRGRIRDGERVMERLVSMRAGGGYSHSQAQIGGYPSRQIGYIDEDDEA